VIIYEEKTKLQSIPVRRKAISVMQGTEVLVVRLTSSKENANPNATYKRYPLLRQESTQKGGDRSSIAGI
jgi:hypothetical protein